MARETHVTEKNVRNDFMVMLSGLHDLVVAL